MLGKGRLLSLASRKQVPTTGNRQPASRASVYPHLQNARKRTCPFPRFACWGVSSPSPKTHPGNRMAARLRCLYAGRLSLVLLRSLRSWRSRLRGKIRPQIFPVREQLPRLFPRVAVHRVTQRRITQRRITQRWISQCWIILIYGCGLRRCRRQNGYAAAWRQSCAKYK